MPKPYRFLDYYRFNEEDIGLFTGREAESATLVSDTVNNRLVVLIAPTGMGKSSLINAGVRPALAELGFRTVWVKVNQDPVASLRESLIAERLMDATAPLSGIAAMLRLARATAKKRLAVFFDQFEEFFLYIPDRDARARALIHDVAEIYRDRGSGVYLVLSLREDFFANLEAFLDEIPTIYQSGSTLRLRAFDLDRGRDAIVLPARLCGVEYDKELVGDGEDADPNKRYGQLVRDLEQNGRIPPVRLQIVCTTLWEERTGAQITAQTYEQLGKADAIIRMRFRRSIETRLNDTQLVLFQQILPYLCSSAEHGTKRAAVSYAQLAQTTGSNEKAIEELCGILGELGMVRITGGNPGTVEWMSDYLSGRLSDLQQTAHEIALRRMIRSAATAFRQAGVWPSAEPVAAFVPDLFLTPENWETLWENRFLLRSAANEPALTLSRDEAQFLLIAALEHGTHMAFWRAEAGRVLGEEIWAILEQCVTAQRPVPYQVHNTIRLLAEEHSEGSMALLEKAMQMPEWINFGIEELGRVASADTLELLKRTLAANEVRPELIEHFSSNWTPAARKLLSDAPLERGPRAVTPASAPGTEAAKVHRVAGNSGVVLSDSEWRLLLRQVQATRCVPILGNASRKNQWVAELVNRFAYPGALPRSFTDVAQYVEEMLGRAQLIEALVRTAKDGEPDGQYRNLAILPLPLYVTTDFDSGIERELVAAGKRPRVVADRWRARSTLNRESFAAGSMSEPLVVYVNGHFADPESLVLTVDDQTEFLAVVSEERDRIPISVRAALSQSTALFLGYRGNELDFNVLRRCLSAQMRINAYRHFLSPGEGSQEAGSAEYLKAYLSNRHIDILDQTPGAFTSELAERWKGLQHDSPDE